MADRRAKAGGGGRGSVFPARHLLACLLLLPFLITALIQSDTMLTRSTQDRVMVVLCSGDAPVEMVIAADGTLSPASDHDAGDGYQPCAWTPHGQPLLDFAATDPQPLRRVERSLDRMPARATDWHRQASWAAAARGPPPAA